MKDVKVRRADLVEKLQENRASHRGIVEKAWAGYKSKVISELEKALERAKKGDKSHIFISLPMPEDHTKDYDRVITMFQMSVDTEIVLSEADFNNYVMDQWGWTGSFTTTNSTYTPV